jgi:hypothetical protein
MSAGLPVIASRVGANIDIATREVGRLAATDDEWLATLRELAADAALRARLGAAGRRRVEADYAIQAWGPRLAGLLRSVAGPQ